MTTRLLLLRHGQTTWNAERRWQGWADAPLSPLGETQARDAAAHLLAAGHAFDRVVCSDLSRAVRTAQLLAGVLGLEPPTVEPDLRERHVGVFEGLLAEEIRSSWPECFDPATGRLLRVPEGEDDAAVLERVVPALVRLATGARCVLVVSHGGVIRALERRLGVEPPAATPNLGGRWIVAEEERLEALEPYLPLELEIATSPDTE